MRESSEEPEMSSGETEGDESAEDDLVDSGDNLSPFQ